MASKIEEALKVKAFAEKHFVQNDFVGAKNYGLKAQMLFPELEGISQMVATFGVYVAAEAKINGELDFYSILGVDASANKSKLKKQYKKMAVLLHPDKNRTVGAEGAFKLVSEAWTFLSNRKARSSYDQRRNMFAGHSSGGGGGYNCSNVSASHGRRDSFWTVCTSCHVQYEYLRKYVNKRLSCKNCRCVFIAVETGLAPVDVPFPYSTYPFGSENGYGSHNYGVSYTPPTTGFCTANRAMGHHTGYRSEYVSNISFQGNSSGNSIGVLDPNGLPASSVLFYQSNGETKKSKKNRKHPVMASPAVYTGTNGCTVDNEVWKLKRGRPNKKRKFGLEERCVNLDNKRSPKFVSEAKIARENGNSKPTSKISSSETSNRHSLISPAFDVRQFLMEKARTVIRTELEDIRVAMEFEKKNVLSEANTSMDISKASGSTETGTGHRSEMKRKTCMSITVPDSDFHDFDQDRSEECFKPKQIWALYDEEDGMPRLYCIIREVLSVKPFKSYISYLSSKSDTEFGSVNWLESGFTKSCGNFRVFSSEMVEQVNIFSHLLSKDKAGRGGCVRIYPRCGDIWAVYRNWSPDWNRTTPDEVRHKYEMVEILDDYSEEHGVWVAPLIKLEGFKTVYQRNVNTDALRYVPRKEMLQFSHQVPSCSLKADGTDLPEDCWDLDPAAIPDELLQGEVELCLKAGLGEMEKINGAPGGRCPVESEGLDQSKIFASSPENEPQGARKAYLEGMIRADIPFGDPSTVDLPHRDNVLKTAFVDLQTDWNK